MDSRSARAGLAERALRLGTSLALIVLALCFLSRATRTGHDQLIAPFSLGPAEFSNLETIKVIRAGANPYAPEVYAAPPLVFSTYTPLYHYLVAPLPMPDANPFLWGRLVAAGAMLLAGLLPFLVGGRSGRLVACVAVGVFFSLAPVASRMVLLRNDSLGLFLTALSVWLVHRAEGRTQLLVAAVGLSMLAVFTKQSFLAAPVACAIYLLVSDRSAFFRFVVAGLGLCIPVVAGVQLGWGSGFWFSTILAPPRATLLEQGIYITGLMLREPLAIALVAMAVLLAVRESRTRGRAALTRSPYLIYVLTSTLVSLATVGKPGSSTNYFLEPILAILMWMTHVSSEAPRTFGRISKPLLAAGLVAAGVLELILIARPAYPWADPIQASSRQRQLEHVRSDIEAFGVERPRILGLADHPGLYRESDRVQLNFPDFYYWLWHSGSLDIAEMTERITSHEFDVIVVPRQWARSRQRVKIKLWGQPAIRMDGPGRLVEAVLRGYRVGASRGAVLYFVPRTANTATGDALVDESSEAVGPN